MRTPDPNRLARLDKPVNAYRKELFRSAVFRTGSRPDDIARTTCATTHPTAAGSSTAASDACNSPLAKSPRRLCAGGSLSFHRNYFAADGRRKRSTNSSPLK